MPLLRALCKGIDRRYHSYSRGASAGRLAQMSGGWGGYGGAFVCL